MQESYLAKRPLTEYEEPPRKRTSTLYQSAVANMQRIARSNVDFAGEWKKIFTERPGITDEAGNTLLHYAVLYHNYDLLFELLANELLDIHAVNLSGDTPLVCAVQANNPKAVMSILKRQPKLTEIYHAFRLSHVINNQDIVSSVEKFLTYYSKKVNFQSIFMGAQIGKLSNSNLEEIKCYVQIEQYKNLKNYVLDTADFFDRFTKELNGETRLNPDWVDNFDADFVLMILGFIRDPQNYPVFINLFEIEEQEEYFYVFLELFFGREQALQAIFAPGPPRIPPDIAEVTWADLRDLTIPAPRDEDEFEIVTDEIIELLKQAPALAVKITNNYFQDEKFQSLEKIFSNMPWWFINIEDLKRLNLFNKSFAKNRLNGDDRFLKLLLDRNAFNINRPLAQQSDETILEYGLLAKVGIPIFRLILEYEPNINQYSSGSTIIMRAIYAPKEYFQEILKHNPDLTLKNPIGTTVLKQAIIGNNYFVVNLLINAIEKACVQHFFEYKEYYIESAKSNLNYHQERKSNGIEITKAQMILDNVKCNLGRD